MTSTTLDQTRKEILEEVRQMLDEMKTDVIEQLRKAIAESKKE